MTTPNPVLVNVPGAGARAINAADLQKFLNPAANPTGAISRSLPDRFGDRMSILDFGVVGNGIADDTAAYQRAINSGAPLLHNAGLTCLISSGLSLIAGTRLVIHGTILLAPNAGTLHDALDVNGNNISVTGDNQGILDGNKTTQTGTGFSAGIARSDTSVISNVYISGLEIKNFLNWPVNLTTGTTNAIVDSCVFHDSGNSPEFHNATDCHFTNCTAYNITDDGIAIYGGCVSCSIDSCTVHDCQSGPQILSDVNQTAPCDSCSITNCYSYNNTLAGIVVAATLAPHTNITVSGNISNTNGNPTNASGIACYSIKGVHRANIHDNIGIGTLAALPTYGIRLIGDLRYIKVHHNVLANQIGGALIRLSAGAGTNVGIDISDNTLFDDQATPTTAIGIQVNFGNNADDTGVTVRNNKFSGGITTNYSCPTGLAKFEGELDAGASNVKTFTQAITVPAITAGSLVTTTAQSFVSIEIGSTTTPGTSFTDYHSSGSPNDFDVRTASTGGTAGTSGLGVYAITAGAIELIAPVTYLGQMTSAALVSGSGVPTLVLPNGSQYFRIDGTTGTRRYVSNGTIWTPVAGE